jgi:magnesium-transporting ATPase (P-type)
MADDLQTLKGWLIAIVTIIGVFVLAALGYVSYKGYISIDILAVVIVVVCLVASWVVGGMAQAANDKGMAQAENDKSKLRNSIILNTVANSLAVIVIGLYTSIKGFTDIVERERYVNIVLTLTLVISLVAVSSVSMNKLASPKRW